MLAFLAILMAVVVGLVFLSWVWRRRIERAKADKAVVCAIRCRGGEISPLLRRWRSGYARLEAGSIVFEPYLPMGFRIRRPQTAPIKIPVESVAADSRPTSGMEFIYYNGDVYEIDTGSELIEWGLAPLVSEWAIKEVVGSQRR
jgi:hypothetical protein